MLLGDLSRLELLAVDVAHHRAVCRTLDRYRGRKLTYVDASSLAGALTPRVSQVPATFCRAGSSSYRFGLSGVRSWYRAPRSTPSMARLPSWHAYS